MKLNVAENTRRNFFWGGIRNIYQILIPFILRTILIRQLGIEYVGMGGLFTSLLRILNLAEMGIGSATIYFLYRPVAENDDVTIKKLLGFIVVSYRRIGFFIFLSGLALPPFFRILFSKGIPVGINIYGIYLLNLLETVLPYWLFAEKSIILEMHQRNDVSNRICLIISTIRYMLQYFMLLYLPNYYLYLIIAILTQVAERVLLAIVVDHRYPAYRTVLYASQEIKEKVLRKTRGLLFHRIGGIVVNSADALVITSFLGLGVLGKYQNYLQIMTAVSGMIGLINSSWYAGIGNTVAREGVDAAYNSFEHYTFLEFCISTVCCCCFLNIYQPFISLWVGVDMLFEDGVVVLLCVYFYSARLMAPGNMFENIGGTWANDRCRPFMEGLFNLGLNLILVQLIDIYGILISTILSMVVLSVPWLYHIVVGKMFKRSTACFLKRLLLYAVSTAMICAVSFTFCKLIPTSVSPLISLFIRALLSMGVPMFLLYMLYHKCDEWKWILGHIRCFSHL